MTTYSEGEATGASASSQPIGWEHDTTLKEGTLAIARERACGFTLGGSSTISGRQPQRHWHHLK